MESFTVDPHAETPPSRQIVEAILDAIARGELVPGAKAPSVRGLAQQALVNPNTVGKAYRDLEHLGVVLGRNGSGVFVTDEGPGIAREMRHRQTLERFVAVAARALASGHDASTLRIALEDAISAPDTTQGKSE